MTLNSPQVARWGLLVTTVALGAVLVGQGLAGYLTAQQTSQSVVRARGLDLAFSVRRALVQSGGQHQQALEEVVADMAEQGLRYAAVVTPGGGIRAAAGDPIRPLPPYAHLVRPHGQVPRIASIDGDRIQVVVPLIAGDGWRRWRPDAAREKQEGKRGGRRGRLEAAPDPWAAFEDRPEPGKATGPRPSLSDKGPRKLGPGTRPLLVLEYEPVVAASITSRALAMLVISLVAATVLLGAGVVFWRLSRRAEAMSEQLARDRQLKALGEMSAVLGHELRNPLTALKGHAQLLVELLGADHPGRRGAETVVREAIRMEDLTGQILEFARTGKVAPQQIDPGDLARSAVELSGLSGIELTVEPDLPPWPIDRTRMERVLINLLRNAVQSTDGDGLVELEVARRDSGLAFAVRDHGPGIPDDEVQWIFEPFHTRKVRGTGLGLAVARRIVEAHEGWIRAENHTRGGAVFTVWLPRS